MSLDERLLTQSEAAAMTALEVAYVRLLAESGLIVAEQGYGKAELAELRRVRRLIDDLGLDHPAVEVVLRMRRRLVALQAEVQRLQTALRLAQRMPRASSWVDAEWTESL